ncbi:MAG: hypothetical protein ACTSPY_00540 [Candidatus Helarchaeota archaeon]
MLIDKLKSLTDLYETKIQRSDIVIDEETKQRLYLIRMAIRNIFKEKMAN